MKNVSEIAIALRDQGRKFNQAALKNTLLNKCVPVYTHGRALIYDDSVIETMLLEFPIHKLEYASDPKSTEINQLDRIEALLNKIDRWFELTPTPHQLKKLQ